MHLKFFYLEMPYSDKSVLFTLNLYLEKILYLISEVYSYIYWIKSNYNIET
jgi:hypothetical protein